METIYQLPPLSIPNSRYTRNLPTAHHEAPEEIGSYSTDADSAFQYDRSALRYYVGPAGQNSAKPLFDGQVQLDLNDGFDISSIHKSNSGWTSFLRWILLNRDRLQTTDFICGRRELQTIMLTPFHGNTAWTIAAVRFRGKIYMRQYEVLSDLELLLEELKRRGASSAPSDQASEDIRKATFTGHKFEQYVTSDSPDGTPNTTEPVNNNKGFYLVVKSRLNDQRLLYAGEVDCVDKNDPSRYIELKTANELTKVQFTKCKLPSAWAQSFLIGVDRIVYGFKDENGIVRRLKTYDTSVIPEYCATVNANKCWSASFAIYFLDLFLKYVKETVQDNSHSFVYVFERRPVSQPGADSRNVTCYREEASKCRYAAFLPDWYTDEIEAA